MFYFDPLYFILVGPAIILTIWAQYKVTSTFKKYSEIRSRSGITGAEAAAAILRAGDVGVARAEGAAEGVAILHAGGYLTDHYNPWKKTLNLSEPVYGSNSIAAIGVAAHEAGHAIQHKSKYIPLTLRSAWVPMAQIGSSLAPWVILIGGFMGGFSHGASETARAIVVAGVWLFGAITAFTLITLPVEFNASARAVAILKESGIVTTEEEEKGVRAVLWAAAMTYVAAAASAVMTLLYYIIRLSGSRSRD